MTVWIVHEFGEEWGGGTLSIHATSEGGRKGAENFMEEVGGDWDEVVASGVLPSGALEWSNMSGTRFVRVTPHDVQG
jgi:hypothetical protein